MSIIDGRWEKGIPHRPESLALIRAVDEIDDDLVLDLKTGGDGDIGETLAYFLDVLIESGKVEIKVNRRSSDSETGPAE